MYTLIRNHAGEAIFRTPSAQGLTIPEKWSIIGVVSRENPCNPLTNAPEMGYNRGGFKGKSLPTP
jgi:hypothetical protein